MGAPAHSPSGPTSLNCVSDGCRAQGEGAPHGWSDRPAASGRTPRGAPGDMGAAWVPTEMEAGSKALRLRACPCKRPVLTCRPASAWWGGGRAGASTGVTAGDHFLQEEGAGLAGRTEEQVPRLREVHGNGRGRDEPGRPRPPGRRSAGGSRCVFQL